MPVSVTVSVPELVTVDSSVAAPSSMSCPPNASVSGERDSWVCWPDPVRPIERSAAVESICTAAVFAPVDVGSKRARTSQLCVGWRIVVSVQSAGSPVEPLEVRRVGAGEGDRREVDLLRAGVR